MSQFCKSAPEAAKEKGLDLVLPNSSEVFVDIDSKAARKMFDGIFEIMKNCFWPKATVRIAPSPSGVAGHEHAYVTIPELDPITPHERVALQAILASDPYRELLAIKGIRAGYEWPSVFFEKPTQAATAAA